jgi:hypothetical protein
VSGSVVFTEKGDLIEMGMGKTVIFAMVENDFEAKLCPILYFHSLKKNI